MNAKLRVVRTHPYYPNFIKAGDIIERYEVNIDDLDNPYIRVKQSDYCAINGGFGMDIPINIDFCDLEIVE